MVVGFAGVTLVGNGQDTDEGSADERDGARFGSAGAGGAASGRR